MNLHGSPTHSIKRERERDHDNASDYDHDRDFMPPNKKDPHAILHALHLQSMQNQFYNNNNRRSAVSPTNNNVASESDHHHHQSRKGHLDQRLSASPIRNGLDKSPTTSTDLMSSSSPVTLLSGMQFKLTSRGKHPYRIPYIHIPALQLNINIFTFYRKFLNRRNTIGGIYGTEWSAI